jgi:predicted ATPase
VYSYAAEAFTDAKRAKSGLLEAASNGILLLDEIDVVQMKVTDTILSLQPGLLPIQPVLLALLEGSLEAPQGQALDPLQRR